MRAGEVTRLILGSTFIYVAVATCAGGVPWKESNRTDGGDETAVDAETVVDARSKVFDAIVSPVRDATAQTGNGSRLKVKYWVGDDGSKTPVPFVLWDSARSEDCVFTTAADGKSRCLPTSGNAFVGSYYSDSGCTKPLGWWSSSSACSGSNRKYASLTDTDCSLGTHIFPVQSAFTGTVYSNALGTCKVLEATALASVSLFSLGAEIPASSFVAATMKTE